MKPYHAEKQFQAAAFMCLNNEYWQFRGMVWHVLNEQATNPIARMQASAQGVVAGVPDLCLIAPTGITHYAELKLDKGRLTPPQKSWHEMAAKRSVIVAVLYPEWDTSKQDWLLQVRVWAQRVIVSGK